MIESEKVNTISPIDAKFHMIQNFIVSPLKQTNEVAVEQCYQTLERCNMLKVLKIHLLGCPLSFSGSPCRASSPPANTCVIV